jgi:O-succinylbenzoic acid--CoA ligase
LPDLTILNLDDPSAPADSLYPDPVAGSPAQPGASPALENLQAAVFTSGTTGRPKAVQITFGNHFFSASASAFRLGLQPGDRWLAPLPLYHVGGLALVFRCLLYGIPLVLQAPARSFDPQALLECIERDQVRIVSLVPTMLERLLEIPGGAQSLARLRFILLGGAAASQALLEKSLAAGLNLALTYGMTETTSQIATSTPQESRAKPGSAGKPLLFYQLCILDEHGATLPAGQTGQIAVAGPTVTPGYYRLATAERAANELSAAQPPPGFLLTGDLGYIDSDGDLWVLQRRADLIISGGENIYPAEVERVLLAHPAVAQACVVGLEVPGWGQQVAAAVVLHPGSGHAEATARQTLIAHCRAHLAGYKIPRRFLFLDQLPQTASGKILRAAVVESLTGQSNESNHE